MVKDAVSMSHRSMRTKQRAINFTQLYKILSVFVPFVVDFETSSANQTPSNSSTSSRSVTLPAPAFIFPQINPYGLLTNSSTFSFNGTKNYRILSGSVHYFRVPHQYWRDRLERLRALGLNTVETYVAWNLHEPSPGSVDFSDDLNIRKFLQTAQSVGLHVILRPGPYICAEWEFGGLPSWLLRDPNMKVRTMYAPFIQAIDLWFAKLFKQVEDLQFMYGGPIIAMQVENEYGSFGRDLEYVKSMGNLLIKHGATELLYCADGASFAGRVPGVMEALDGQIGLASGLTRLRTLQPNMPLFVAEFWSGWFDRWGEKGHHTWSADLYLQQLNSVLFGPNAASINFYMAHGGTNFGFMAGASVEPTADARTWKYTAVTTSYDYDALIGEDGTLHPTKFNATRQILARVFNNRTLPALPGAPVRRAYGRVSPNGFLPLYPEAASGQRSMLDFVKNVRNSSEILPMELLDNVNNGAGQQYGYVLYRRDLSDVLPQNASDCTLIINGGVRDRLTVMYGGVQQDTPYPRIMSLHHDTPVSITLDNAVEHVGQTLNILVENRGRVSGQNFGWTRDFMNNQRKGLQGTVELWTYDGEINFHTLDSGWNIYSLDFNRDFMRSLIAEKNSTAFQPLVNLTQHKFPAMLRFIIDVGRPENVADSFLFVPTATMAKGVAFVNGRNLGRFWNVGPQKSLYIPKWYWNYTAGGNNTVMIFVEEAVLSSDGSGPRDFTIELRDTPDLGPVTAWYGAISL